MVTKNIFQNKRIHQIFNKNIYLMSEAYHFECEWFIVIYHAPNDFQQDAANSDPEEMKKGMEEWMVWAKKCGDQLVDMGTPLVGGQKLSPDDNSSKSEKGVVGYSVLQANNIEEAKALLTGHPHLNWNPGCEIEVHETMEMQG
jgi:hypothetical protein